MGTTISAVHITGLPLGEKSNAKASLRLERLLVTESGTRKVDVPEEGTGA
jgi:hypothetical protein